jgi:hypothetical protein
VSDFPNISTGCPNCLAISQAWELPFDMEFGVLDGSNSSIELIETYGELITFEIRAHCRYVLKLSQAFNIETDAPTFVCWSALEVLLREDGVITDPFQGFFGDRFGDEEATPYPLFDIRFPPLHTFAIPGSGNRDDYLDLNSTAFPTPAWPQSPVAVPFPGSWFSVYSANSQLVQNPDPFGTTIEPIYPNGFNLGISGNSISFGAVYEGRNTVTTNVIGRDVGVVKRNVTTFPYKCAEARTVSLAYKLTRIRFNQFPGQTPADRLKAATGPSGDTVKISTGGSWILQVERVTS